MISQTLDVIFAWLVEGRHIATSKAKLRITYELLQFLNVCEVKQVQDVACEMTTTPYKLNRYFKHLSAESHEMMASQVDGPQCQIKCCQMYANQQRLDEFKPFVGTDFKLSIQWDHRPLNTRGKKKNFEAEGNGKQWPQWLSLNLGPVYNN